MTKRKRRRSRADVVSAGTVRAIKARKRAFLSEVSHLLSEALGFSVRVSMVPAKVDKTDWTPAMRKASRLSKSAARRQIAAAADVPFFDTAFGRRTFVNDPLPTELLGEDDVS